MKKLRTFASTMTLTLIITPATALADGGYNDNSDGYGSFLFGIGLVIFIGVIVVVFLLED